MAQPLPGRVVAGVAEEVLDLTSAAEWVQVQGPPSVARAKLPDRRVAAAGHDAQPRAGRMPRAVAHARGEVQLRRGPAQRGLRHDPRAERPRLGVAQPRPRRALVVLDRGEDLVQRSEDVPDDLPPFQPRRSAAAPRAFAAGRAYEVPPVAARWPDRSPTGRSISN